MIGGILFTAMGIYFLMMSYEKVGSFDRMNEEQLESWRNKNKKYLRVLSIIVIVGGVLQILGLVHIW